MKITSIPQTACSTSPHQHMVVMQQLTTSFTSSLQQVYEGEDPLREPSLNGNDHVHVTQ
jgi:hypothetical protein